LDVPEFFYVTYPLPINMADKFPAPAKMPPAKASSQVPLSDDEDFEPVWYGAAAFPEDV